MTNLSRALLSVGLVFAISACQQQSAPTQTTAKPAAPAPAPTQPVAAPTASSIGVAECDDYLNKYEACVNGKVPEAARASLKQSLDATRGAWKSAAATPAGKEGLASACKQAYDASKAAMSQYGCTDF